MIALRVRINNEEPVTAGADDLSVLNASISSLSLHRSSPQPDAVAHMFDCHLGGLTSRAAGVDNEHLSWLKRWDLKVGDKVTVEIVEVDHANPVISSKVSKRKHNDSEG